MAQEAPTTPVLAPWKVVRLSHPRRAHGPVRPSPRTVQRPVSRSCWAARWTTSVQGELRTSCCSMTHGSFSSCANTSSRTARSKKSWSFTHEAGLACEKHLLRLERKVLLSAHPEHIGDQRELAESIAKVLTDIFRSWESHFNMAGTVRPVVQEMIVPPHEDPQPAIRYRWKQGPPQEFQRAILVASGVPQPPLPPVGVPPPEAAPQAASCSCRRACP